MTSEEKLARYEKMQDGIQSEFAHICSQMEQLKAQGKIKTVTYKTLLGKKMMYQNILSMYDIYGL